MLKTLTALAANIPAALVGGLVFVLALFALNLGVGLSLMVALCAYVIAGTWIFPLTPRSIPQPPEIKVSQPKPAVNLFQESEYQLSRMQALIAQIRKRTVRDKARQIHETADQILEAIQRDPGDARTSQQFASYYLDPTNSILAKYLEISDRSDDFGESHGLAERIELILDNVHAAFEKQHANVLNDGMLYLDLEIAALEETIK